MPYEILCSLRHLTDEELEARLRGLAGSERDATAQLVAHLAELDTRDLHLRAGYGSLFAYCRDALHLSEHEAYNRIEAARAARRFPLVLVLLASGAVSLTTVRLLAPTSPSRTTAWSSTPPAGRRGRRSRRSSPASRRGRTRRRACAGCRRRGRSSPPRRRPVFRRARPATTRPPRARAGPVRPRP